jgi:uncharacterized phage infection (PIP) family protein YhgE
VAAQAEGLSGLQTTTQTAFKNIEERLRGTEEQTQGVRTRLGLLESTAGNTSIAQTDLAHMELQLISHGQQLRSEIEELRSAIKQLHSASSRGADRDARHHAVSGHRLISFIDTTGKWRWLAVGKVFTVVLILAWLFRWRSVLAPLRVLLQSLTGKPAPLILLR